MKKIKLAFYRARLKSAYLRYRSIHDEYDCGAALTEHISNRAVGSPRSTPSHQTH